MVDNQVGGTYTQYGDRLFMVTVRGAVSYFSGLKDEFLKLQGHMVPTDKPATAFYILDHFLNNKPF